MIFLPNGIGESTGDALVTAKPFQATGQVFYVSSATGDNAYAGLNKAQPKATLASALSSAANGDVIVLLDGHTEGYTAPLTLSKSVTIVGSGSESGVPTVNFRKTTASGAAIFEVTADGVQLRNIKFRSSSVSDAAARIEVQADALSIVGCYFECGNNDPTAAAVQVDAAVANLLVKNTSFVATNTSASTPPGPGIELSGTSTDFRLDGVVFDGGAFGFDDGIAYVELDAATRRYAENISMLRGADVSLGADAVQSYWLASTSSGDARIST